MTDPEKGHLALDYDEARNLIRVVGSGRWRLDQFERHVRRVEAAARGARRTNGYVRLIMDLRGAGIQSADVSRRMIEVGETLYKPYDRVALIVGSEVMKLQIENTRRRAEAAYFLSPEAGEAWLLAGDTARSGPKLELEWGPAPAAED
jgi:hypothetical protein